MLLTLLCAAGLTAGVRNPVIWADVPDLDGRVALRFDHTRFFMGTKFALFYYATKEPGGHADFDRFDFISP